MPFTRIVPLDRYNWEACLDIRIAPEQEAFMPPILYSLAQAKFENLHPFGIESDGHMVGMLMYGEFGGICWLSRVLIDVEYQHQGIGTEAVKQLLELLGKKISCREIRTSHARNNHVAAAFFDQLNFVPLPDALSEEVVRVYVRRLGF